MYMGHIEAGMHVWVKPTGVKHASFCRIHRIDHRGVIYAGWFPADRPDLADSAPDFAIGRREIVAGPFEVPDEI